MTSTTTNSEPSVVEKLHGLRWNTLSNAASSIFIQYTFFGSIFILFLSELGLRTGQIGFMLSLFPFAGLIAPLIAPRVARHGYKRTYLTFWGIRKTVTAGLLLVPIILAQFGQTVTLVYVTLIIGGFAIARAVAETAVYPWSQEYIPDSVRGKYAAINNVFSTIVGLIAVAFGGLVLERGVGLAPYMWLIGIGVISGYVSLWASSYVPGGAPTATQAEQPPRALGTAARDGNFRNYLIGVALMTLAIAPLTSFLPLFMREQVGLNDSQIVLLQNGVLIGGLISVYMWGWAADRFGSTPIMLSGIVACLLLPILWLLMPRNSEWSLPAAAGIAFLQGITRMGWVIGSARLLFVSVVPPDKKADYLALYYAWIGVVGGVSQLIGGWLIHLARNLSGNLLTIPIDPYTPLFLLGLILPIISLFVLRRIHIADEVGMLQFADILLRGHPLSAVESMIRFRFARDEAAVVISTEKLGQAKSLLAVEELLESLQDPRFNVRFEAIVAIGRSRHDERLINALADILHSSDPALSVMAAWALGRIGSAAGLPTLRQALNSPYRSIRAHSARSLATLKDEASVEILRSRLLHEKEPGLKLAYASALGRLQDTTTAPTILAMLRNESDELARAELALAIARLVGDESKYVQLLRQVRADSDTALSQAVLGLSRRYAAHTEALAAAASAFGAGDAVQGIQQLTEQVTLIRAAQPAQTTIDLVLDEVAQQIDYFAIARVEYIVLQLFILAE